MTAVDFLREYGLSLLQTGASALLLWACWSLRHLFVTRRDYAADEAERAAAASRLAASLDKLDDRLTQLETRVDHLPTDASIHRLELRVEDMQGRQREQSARLDGLRDSLAGVSATLQRLDTYLLEHK